MGVIKRLNWLKWLYPGEAGLQSDQDWHIDKRRAHMVGEHLPGVTSGLEVIETSPTPDLEVHVQPGRVIDGDGEEVVFSSIVDVDLSSYASGGATVKIVVEYDETGTDPYIVPETAASQDKFLQDDPKVTVITGALTAKQVLLAQVVVGNGATQITDVADPDNPGTDEIDLRDRDATTPRGFRAVQDLSGDAELSMVTVGEYGCDFNDLRNAVAFVNGLTRSKSRQVEILLFEKRDGQYWSISSAITIPSWTHLVGVGKPTIEQTVSSGDVITLNEGSSLENVCVETSVAGIVNVIATSSDDVTIRNVDVRYEYTSSLSSKAINIKTGNRIRIENFRLFPNSSIPTAGCQGISMGLTGDVYDVVIKNCDLRGDRNLILREGSDNIYRLHISGLMMVATATASSGGMITLFSLNDSVLSDICGECEAGPTRGVLISAVSSTVVSGIVLKATTSDDIILLAADDCVLHGVDLTNGRAEFGPNARVSTGSVSYTFSDTNPAVELGNSSHIENFYVNRGGGTLAPGIAAAAGASDCIVAGCQVFIGLSWPSIKGVSGADNWLIQGCITRGPIDLNGSAGWMVASEEGDVRKDTDESVVNSVVLQDDDELKFYMKANKKYDFEFMVFFSSTSNIPDIQLAVNGPTGLTDLRAHIMYGDVAATGIETAGGIVTAYDAVGTAPDYASVPNTWARIKGSIENGTTAGDLVLRWAQRLSNALAIVVKKGSYLRFREVP